MVSIIQKVETLKSNLENLSIDEYRVRFQELQNINDSLGNMSSMNFNELFRSEISSGKTGFSVSEVKESKNKLLFKLNTLLTTNCDFLIGEIKSLSVKKKETDFIDTGLIERLKNKTRTNYDTKKLVQYLVELNSNYRAGNVISCIMIIRAVMNYVPPIFGQRQFSNVVLHHNPNPIKNRNDMLNVLQQGARPVGDLHNHDTITSNDLLPTANQIEPFKPHFEYLIQEVIKII